MDYKDVLNNLVDDMIEDAVLNTLETVSNLQEDSKDVLIEIMEEDGATETEIAMAKHFVEKYVDILNDLIDDEFEIMELDCNGDCDNCVLNSDED